MTKLCKYVIIEVLELLEIKQASHLGRRRTKMSKMIVFEVFDETGVKKTFVANYVLGDERLFSVNLNAAELVKKDRVIKIEALTSIRRYTDGGFVTNQFHAGDLVKIDSDGNWEFKHSLRSYVAVLLSRLRCSCEEMTFKVRKAVKGGDKLGSIKRTIKPTWYVDLDFGFPVE